MKILFYTTSVALNPHNGVLLDEAEKYIKEGHEVVFLLCDESYPRCFANPLKESFLCQSCKRQQHFLLGKLSSKIKKYSLKLFFRYSENDYSDKTFEYNSIQEVFGLYYKGVDIGYAAASSYITLTRNLDPLVSPQFKELMDDFLRSGIIITDALEVAIEQLKPDRICLFNGRFVETRPVLRVAMDKGVETYVYEVIGSPSKYKKVFFKNALPHDIENITTLINDFWDKSVKTESEKNELAESFFIRKRQGLAVVDKAYTEDQILGKLPDNWNITKRNFVIFNSSEDEFAAVGNEYKEKLFTTQIEGIRFILETNKRNEEIHFYLRIHPNLADITYKYHLDLIKFEEYDNCTVIKAGSDISTYTLIDNAEKIIVFGSTVGLEATYWSKPVILLGASFYKNMNVAYYPETKSALESLLVNQLSPKEVKDSLKLGYFFVGDRGHVYEFFNFNPVNFKNIFHYQKLFKSNIIYYLIFIMPFSILLRLKRLFNNNMEVPRDER